MKLLAAVAFGLLFCLVTTAPILADDLLPPDWRGAPHSTFQVWEFSTDANPAEPDLSDNPFGSALATIYGEFDYPDMDTYWLAKDHEHLGVWNIGGSMSLEIPNDPRLGAQKLIRLQLTYDGSPTPDIAPQINVLASDNAAVADFQLVEHTVLDDWYVHDTYDIVLEPNPQRETIWLLPRFCQLYVDEIVVDTMCVPEPSSLVILVAGAIAVAACVLRPGRRS
jgi:hypothetical protein